jgi:molybdopterin converting factor small subunit
MQVALKLYATLSDYLPPEAARTNRVELEVTPETTVADLVGMYRLPEKLVHLVLVDGVYIAPADRTTRVLREGEVVAMWPPIAGG